MYYKMSARNSYNVAPIPGDNNGGSGGGGGDGPSADGGLPVGSVIPYAGTTTPQKWLLCNGTEYNQATAEDLYGVIGYSYGVNPGSTSIVQGSGGAIYGYDTSTNTLTIAGTNVVNTFIKVGTYVKLSGATATTGVNINGTIVLITLSNVAINGTGVGGIQYQGTFVNPVGSGAGGGSGMVTTFNRFSVPVPDLRLASPIGAQAGTINLGTSGGSATTTITANNLPSHQHGMFQPGSRALSAASGNLCGDFNVDANLRTIRGETYVEGSTESNGALVQNLPISTRNPYVALNYIIKAET
jgi:microcystin-dependent protein